jgi:protein PhnA
MTDISQALKDRNNGTCELCNTNVAIHGYTVTPKKDDQPQNQVALCAGCYEDLDQLNAVNHWRCLEGSIWSGEPAVQALSRRLLKKMTGHSWAQEALSSVDLPEEIIEWSDFEGAGQIKHVDGFGNILNTGDK